MENLPPGRLYFVSSHPQQRQSKETAAGSHVIPYHTRENGHVRTALKNAPTSEDFSFICMCHHPQQRQCKGTSWTYLWFCCVPHLGTKCCIDFSWGDKTPHLRKGINSSTQVHIYEQMGSIEITYKSISNLWVILSPKKQTNNKKKQANKKKTLLSLRNYCAIHNGC